MLDKLELAQKRIEALEAFIDKSITTKRLRDEFAMAALPALACDCSQDETARYCYVLADAMMAEREKTK